MKNWNLYEKLWLFLFVIVAIIITLYTKDSLFGFSVFLTGILCVVLAAKGNIWTYVFGMYNTFGYAYLAYSNELFGEMGLNLLFFAPMNVIGFLKWRKNMADDSVVEMRALSLKGFMVSIIISIVCILLMGFGLSFIPGQKTPYIDATTNILSIVATFLMTFRYREQWIYYIVLNVFTVLMWTIRWINGSSDGMIMVLMWSAYLINAVYGYINWTRGSKKAINKSFN